MSRVLPIFFNTDMVRAILDGRKTVTRRVIKPQPKMALSYIFAGCNYGKWNYPPKDAWEVSKWDEKYKWTEDMTKEDAGKTWNPPYHADDIIYVRETWQVYQTYPSAFGFDVAYRADQEIRPCIFSPERYEKFIKYENSKNYPRWISSQFMPKEAARIWLKVTGVRVERLQDITAEQCIREGVEKEALEVGEQFTRGIFNGIWDSTIKKPDLDCYGWNANPYVFVIEFERCEKPEIN